MEHASQPRAVITVHDLPIDALTRVFSRICTIARVHALPLVCRRWRDLLAGPSAAWSDLQLELPHEFSLSAAIRKNGAAAADSFLAWLRPRAGAVESISIDTQYLRSSAQLAVIQCVSSRLVRLNLATFKGAYLADVLAATRLTMLEVSDLQAYQDAEVGVLSCLPALRVLSLSSSRPIDPPDVALCAYDAAAATGYASPLPPPPLSGLSALTGLRCLRLLNLVNAIGSQLGCLTDLEELSFTWRYGLAVLPEEISRCTGLHCLQVNRTPQFQAAELELPRGVTSLRGLRDLWLGGVSFTRHGGALPWNLPQGLTRLALVQPDINDDNFRGLAALSNLRVLVLRHCRLRFHPGRLATVASLPSPPHRLEALSLSGNFLQDLPQGQYLSGLMHLDLSDNCFDRVPACLRGAPMLRKLDCSYNRSLYLGRECLEVLCSLTSLRSCGLNPLLRQGAEVDSHRIAALLTVQRRLGSGVFVQGDLIKRDAAPGEQPGGFIITCDCHMCGLTVKPLWGPGDGSGGGHGEGGEDGSPW